MIEHWTTVAYMAKVKSEEHGFNMKPVKPKKKRNFKTAKRNNSNPSYYAWLQSFGSYLIKLGTKIENKFDVPNYRYDVVKLDA